MPNRPMLHQIVYVLTTLLTLIFLAAAALFAHFIR